MAKYNQYPETKIKQYDAAWAGYDAIVKELKQKTGTEKKTLIIESYIGIDNKEILENLIKPLKPEKIIFSDDLAFNEEKIIEMTDGDLIPEDRVFGILTHYEVKDFFDPKVLEDTRKEIEKVDGLTVIYGTGASLVTTGDILIYADLARWEAQLRYRAGATNWKINNPDEDILKKYKRGYFLEWRISDKLKDQLHNSIDYLLDTNRKNDPAMVSGKDYRHGLSEVVTQPFRGVPYFDVSVWGGTWMEENFGLEHIGKNYGWAFDGVPEENSLYLRYGDVKIEVPSINLVHQYPNELLGAKVHSRFGKEFPIRFDYLDTMNGGNLSLQVHPLTEYIQEKFGMYYTQDESYYILDAKEDASVYLGVKENTDLDEMVTDLKKAQDGDYTFPDEKYVNKYPAKKHDHFLIPAGTVHCGGSNVVVLEISATPYIFTFKLWDWGRIGLDGKPRPVHIDHGKQNIQTSRTTSWVKENLINNVQEIKETKDHKEERTGLHELEFIETRRHWFDKPITLHTKGSVNMLNLIEGEEAVVESIDGSFDPYEIHYGETFIIPAQIKEYKIIPKADDHQKLAIMQAYVR